MEDSKNSFLRRGTVNKDLRSDHCLPAANRISIIPHPASRISSKLIIWLFIFLIAALSSMAQLQWKVVGQLKTRDAKQIKASTWSIGGETLDRDYTDYQSYKTYLGPLGAKRIRFQGGWSKCEKIKGVYDFAWLDAIIPDAASRGVSPWVELSYGNPIYEGGGEAKLAGHIPTSPEALKAWDRWVTAMVNRYKHAVPEWEIWNEPDLNKSHSGKEIGEFYLRTARIVRSIQPDARLIALGMASVTRLEFVKDFMDHLQQNNGLNYIDILTYHGYAHNPDESYPKIEILRQLVWRYKPSIVFMQGENGAPSTLKEVTIGALRDKDWSELTQAKWDLRRMLGDHGRGIATNLFTISDIHYAAGDHMVGVNTKGILKTNPDKTIDRPKIAYKAAQHVFSFFDSQVILDATIKIKSTRSDQSFFAYKHVSNMSSLFTIWQHEDRPSDTYEPKATTLIVEGAMFKDPVLADLITGKVYEIPKANFKKAGNTYTFKDIPVPDYPIMLAEKSSITMTTALEAQTPNHAAVSQIVTGAGVSLKQVSTNKVIHRFFDTSPLSPSGKYLALFRMPYENKSPQPGDAGEVVVVNMQTGKERVVAQSRGWEVQLGANVQWGKSDKVLLFNDVDTATWKAFCVVLNPLTGKSRKLDGTIFMASNNGKKIASYNLTNSIYAQVGYGVVIPRNLIKRNIGPVDSDGIYVTDIASGKVKRIVTIREIFEKTTPSITIPNPQDYEYYCFQVKWNPQGTRLLTTVQWAPLNGGPRLRAVITMRTNGTDLYTAITPGQWAKGGHHINWMPDGEYLSMNLNVDGKPGLEFITVKYDGNEMKTVFTPGSGHPSFHPKGLPLIVTDAYPDEPITKRNGTVPIRLLHTDTQKEEKIAEVFVSNANGEFRIDPHPAWDRSGRYIIFNGFIGNTRNVFIADLKNVIGSDTK